MNLVIESGNLTRDAETRYTKAGMAVVSFSIAVNERQKVNNEWTDVPNYFDVTWFGSYAEKAAQSLVKGARVWVQGRLKWSQYEKNGEKRTHIEIIADKVETPKQQQTKNQPAILTGVYDDDCPF